MNRFRLRTVNLQIILKGGERAVYRQHSANGFLTTNLRMTFQIHQQPPTLDRSPDVTIGPIPIVETIQARTVRNEFREQLIAMTQG